MQKLLVAVFGIAAMTHVLSLNLKLHCGSTNCGSFTNGDGSRNGDNVTLCCLGDMDNQCGDERKENCDSCSTMFPIGEIDLENELMQSKFHVCLRPPTDKEAISEKFMQSNCAPMFRYADNFNKTKCPITGDCSDCDDSQGLYYLWSARFQYQTCKEVDVLPINPTLELKSFIKTIQQNDDTCTQKDFKSCLCLPWEDECASGGDDDYCDFWGYEVDLNLLRKGIAKNNINGKKETKKLPLLK